MTPCSLLGRTFFAFATFVFVSNLRAADKLDLDRDTPVPADQPIPVQDFFRAPIIDQPVVNPNGTHIVALVSSGVDHNAAIVYDLQTKSIEPLGTRDIDSDIDWVDWLGNDRIGFRISFKKMSGTIYGSAKVGSLQISAHPVLQGIGAAEIAIPPGDRIHPLFNLYPNGVATGRYGQVVHVYGGRDSGSLLDMQTINDGSALEKANEDNLRNISKRYPVLETPDGFQIGYFADGEGSLAYGMTSTNGVESLHRLDGDRWQNCPENMDEIHVIAAGDNPGEIVALGARADNKPRPLVIMKAATGEVLDTLIADKAYDANAWIYRDPHSHRIVGANYDRSVSRVVWFDDNYRELQKMVDGLFKGQVVRIIGNDEKGKMLLIISYSDQQPPVYRWVDLEKHTVNDIRQSRPWIDPKRMQTMGAIKYKTLDGRSLDAYVLMPAGASKAKPPPLVVVPPQGTNDHYAWGYNSLAQYLASRGYAVLLPNHRGSAGTTWMFPTEDEWAYRKMHEDVTQATKAFIASGLVDPHRVAILGTDFGGFLALSGAAYQPDLYRCSVAISPVADWGRYIADRRADKYQDAYFTRMTLKLGDPSRDPAKWDAIAPLRHAGDIRSAVFVSTSEYDNPMLISAAKDIASAAERNHVPVETASFLDEVVGVHHLKNEVDLYSRIEAFLAKNL
ncbi:MAG TPA: alpha/beta fold hydrolase [Candidatus Didemnitutus sp.]|nr:alpha/beta fold hydrolase [Candidatus Didemnitutus sp.]